MFKIIGVGCAYPDSIIENDLLREFLKDDSFERVQAENGILRRRTSLPLNYLVETKNCQVDAVIKAGSESPTSLGVKAAQSALAQAGIGSSDVGLVIADCFTPWENIPAEATRIGKHFSLKTPAYDILGVGSGLFFLDILKKWRAECVPDYVLFVITSTPTQRIDYREGVAGCYFGDCAVAFIVSAKGHSGLKIVDSDYVVEKQEHLKLDMYGHLQFDLSEARKAVDARLERWIVRLSQMGQGLSGSYFIGPQFEAACLSKLYQKYQIDPGMAWDGLAEYGCCLAASGMAALATNMDKLQKGDSVVLLEAGPGSGSGYSILIAD